VTAGVEDGPGRSAGLQMTARVVHGTLEVVVDGATGPVECGVWDVAGRRVRYQREAVSGSGQLRWSWDLWASGHGRVNPGVMFVRVRSGPRSITRKVILIND
jgi:hypothetical protein